MKTLDRVLSKAGVGSRTEARSSIGAGRVSVNGKVVRSPDFWVDPERDDVSFDGRPLQAQEPLYIALYKPKGYITTYKDPEGRATVYDLLAGVQQWVAPVGRLDQDSSGLLLLTNDTEWADGITDPQFHVLKTYQVKTSSLLADEACAILAAGVELRDGLTRPAVVKRLRESASATFLEITISEGRNRQVRRMIEAVGSKVRKLVRIAIGDLRIGELPIGEWRELTAKEVRALRSTSHPGRSARVAPRRSMR